MEALPLVSCIMPTYGRPDYVSESVAMFLAQDYPRKELIVLNDCAGQYFTGEFPNVRIVNQDARFASLGEKRNACIEMAKGSLIAIWDDDDVHLPWRLSYSLSEMRRLETLFYRPSEIWAYWGHGNLDDSQTVPGWGNHGSAVFSKDLWRIVGGYPAMDCGEDAEFFEGIYAELEEPFIKYELAPVDRFYILRGTSHYAHMSMNGGRHPLDTEPSRCPISPVAIGDPILRAACERLIDARARNPRVPSERSSLT